MNPSSKRILVVAYETTLRASRVAILEKAGYVVASVFSDDDAMKALETEQVDLVLIGTTGAPQDNLDKRLREKYPKLRMLKIQPRCDVASEYSSRTTDAMPEHVVNALKEMLS
jgi:DNA-binding NtrC family response regulator